MGAGEFGVRVPVGVGRSDGGVLRLSLGVGLLGVGTGVNVPPLPVGAGVGELFGSKYTAPDPRVPS